MYKKYVYTICSILCFMAFASFASAEDASKLSTIEVEGRAQIMVTPNVATISFAVETDAPGAQEAVEGNAGRMNKLLNNLKRIAGKETKIRTSGFTVSPVYEKGDRLRPKGYRVRNTVILETKKLENIAVYIDEASKTGANRIGSLVFSTDKKETFRREAAAEALRQAMRNAEDLAKTAGLKVNRIVKISYVSREITPSRRYFREASAPAARTPIEVGEIPIEASVNVVFEAN